MAKIRVKLDNKILETEIPAKDHLESQIKYPSRVHKSKKAYTRKKKHKKDADQTV